MNPLWVLSRATGFVSLLLLTVIMVVGVLVTRQQQVGRLPRFVLVGLHRNAALLGVVFIALHIAAVVYDPYVSINWIDAVIPFRSSYRPLWVGLGAVSLDIIVALVVTSLLRARIPAKVWRGVHWAAYACWPIALVHGLGTGDDTTRPLGIAVDALSTVAVLLAVVWRLRTPQQPEPEVRAATLLAQLEASRPTERVTR